MAREKECDVRIATYDTNHGKSTSIRFYDGKEALIDASRVVPKISGDQLYFVPQANGLALSNANIQVTTKLYPAIQDGLYWLQYDSDSCLYFVDFKQKDSVDIDKGRRTGVDSPKRNGRVCKNTRRKAMEEADAMRKEVNEMLTEVLLNSEPDICKEESVKTVTNPAAEGIIRAFLENGLDKAIEAGNLDDIKAFHRILKTIN